MTDFRAWNADSNDFVAVRGSVDLLSGRELAECPSVRFVTSVFRLVPSVRFESIAFQWTTGTPAKKGRGAIEFCCEDGVTAASVPFVCPLGYWQSTTTEVFTAKDGSQAEARALLEKLERGARIRLTGDVGRLDFSVNRRHPSTASDATYLRLVVRYSTSSEKLVLPPHVKILPDEYVTTNATGDQLVYRGKPLRLSGVNVSRPYAYRQTEAVLDRLALLNGNAVRLWTGPLYPPNATNEAPAFMSSKKGDGSPLDGIDYFVWRCQERGIFLHCTTTGSHQPPIPPAYADVGRNAYWVFPEMIARKNLHARNFLAHVNPYSGRKLGEMSVFATYELFNEDGFAVEMTGGCFKKWTAAHQAYLKDLYCAFLTRKYGRTTARDPADDHTSADFLEFVLRLQAAANRKAEAAARACAASGKGVNVAPIIHGTHPLVNMNTQFVHQLGQGASVGAYQAMVTRDQQAPFYPWKPFFTRRPYFYNMMWQTPPNKIFTVYEHHPHCPYDLRAEWMPAITMVGGGLGWDAMYFFTFGVPHGMTGDFDLVCAGSPIAMPLGTDIERYNENYNALSDEVMMGGFAVCGQAFINGLKPNVGRTVVIYGRDAVYNPAFHLYSPGSKGKAHVELAERSDDQTKEGVEAYKTVSGMFARLQETALRHELLVGFDPRQKAPIRIEGELAAEPTQAEFERPCRLTPNDEITWDPPAMRSTLDAVHSKLAFGVLPAELVFRDGVSFRQPDPLRFTFFGISSRDGKSFAQSKDILLNVSSEAKNTGYVFDSERMTSGVKQHVPAILCRGTAPVIVTHPSGTVTVPGPAFTLRRYNFAGYLYSEEQVTDGAFEIRPDEPLFLARLIR